MKKYRDLLILNVGIALCTVACYSPGLINLRLSDESIFRAGMSIIMVFVLAFAFFYGNSLILKGPERKRVSKSMISDVDKAEALLKTYFDVKHCGKMAKTASDQLGRMLKSIDKTKVIIEERFGTGTLSGSKFYSIIEAAQDSALNNIVTMANRMQMFDEVEYERLQDHRNDGIPDELQEKQLELQNTNLEQIQNTIVLNEKILLSVDNLLMELTTKDIDENEDCDILEEIKKLTEEAKLYH